MTSRKRPRAGGKPPIIAVLAAASLALLLVVPATWAGVFRPRNPHLALSVAPFDGEAKAAAAMSMLSSGADPANLARAGDMARQALARSPLSVAGVRVLGLIADLRSDRRGAEKLLALSTRISRRDLPTRLWLIETAVSKNDISTALKHYDIALRTSTSARPLLFPVLLSASTDPAIAGPLAQYLRQDRPWTAEFVEELVEKGPDPAAAYQLTRGRFDPKDEADRRRVQLLLYRLISAKRFGLALSLYASMQPRGIGAGQAVRDGGFQAGGDYPPFDWDLVDSADLGGGRAPRPNTSENMALWLRAASGRTGVVARQLLRLPPGSYRLAFMAGGVPEAVIERPAIAITCASNSRSLIDYRPVSSAASGATFVASVSVPPDCAWQWLTVSAKRDSENETWVDDLSITPAAATQS
jgi:hypothetical protein